MTAQLIIQKIDNFKDAQQYLDLFYELYQDRKNQNEIKENLSEMFKHHNYQLLVGLQQENKTTKQAIAICGINENLFLHCGKFLQISNLYIKQSSRRSGIASKMLEAVKSEAKSRKIEKIYLNSYTNNFTAHKSYFREGYMVEAFNFLLELGQNN